MPQEALRYSNRTHISMSLAGREPLRLIILIPDGGKVSSSARVILRDADEQRVKEGPSSSSMLNKQHGFLNGSKLMFEQVKLISVNLQK